jgi:hypothetical protein
MTVWEITHSWANDAAGLTHADDIELDPVASAAFWKQFEGLGSPLQWRTKPRLTAIEHAGGKKRPRADVSPFTSPGLILNARVRDALGDLLLRFGQLLEVDVDGRTEYYYNVTNVLRCLDKEKSRFEAYYVERPVFQERLIPETPVVFVEPELPGRIFVNEGAKSALDKGIAESNIIGMSFRRADVSGLLELGDGGKTMGHSP